MLRSPSHRVHSAVRVAWGLGCRAYDVAFLRLMDWGNFWHESNISGQLTSEQLLLTMRGTWVVITYAKFTTLVMDLLLSLYNGIKVSPRYP
jgi:hypothetical protein